MTDTFKVGEIAIYVRPGSPYFGQEVEILSDLHLDEWSDRLTGKRCSGMCYFVSLPVPNGFVNSVAEPKDLKKKKPPARDIDQKVSWNDCIWKPAGVVA